MPKEPLLNMRGAGRRYSAVDPQWALHEVDLAIYPGDFVAITGPSGAGKSTLLNCLALLDKLDAGEYLIRGNPVTSMSSRSVDGLRSDLFGFVFQGSNAVESRTVAKNVEIPLSSNGTPRSERVGLVTNALRRANLLHRANQNVSLLSGGERQRMAIARALAGDPRILFLDEPTGNLDSANTAAIVSLLKDLNQAGTTIVLVTHDNDLAHVARRRFVVRDGHVTDESPAVVPATNSTPDERPNVAQPVTRRFGLALSDAISEAAFSMFSRVGRTLVGLVAIGLGVAGLVASVNLGLTAHNQVDKVIATAALDEVTVTMKSTDGSSNGDTFSSDALTAISALDGVVAAGAKDSVSAADANVTRFGHPEQTGVSVIGATAGSFEAMGIGTPPRASDLLDIPVVNDRIAIVGHDAASTLGIQPGLAQTVWIGGERFDVVAVAQSSSRDSTANHAVMIASNVVKSLGLPARHQLIVRTSPGRSFVVGEAVPLALDPANPGRFNTTGAANLAELRRGVSTSLDGLLLALAIVFLGIAVLSTSSALSNSVLQRRAEIGLRMATGSSPSRVAGMFLVEGSAIGLAGGITGASVGAVAVLAVSFSQGWTPNLDPATLLLGALVGVLTGLIASVLPSIRASRVQPALALRG